jgi:hypothetical protein
MCKQVAYDVTQKLLLYAVTKSLLQQRLRQRLQRCGRCTNTYFESQYNKQQNMKVYFLIAWVWELLDTPFYLSMLRSHEFRGHKKNHSGDLIWKVHRWKNFDLKMVDPSEITTQHHQSVLWEAFGDRSPLHRKAARYIRGATQSSRNSSAVA